MSRERALRSRLLWLCLPVLALWPLWLWSARRLSDGLDDPYGVFALATLLLVLWRDRGGFCSTPRGGWLSLSVGLAGVATLLWGRWPALLCATLGVLAVLTAALALRHHAQPRLAWFGLGLLALPLLSSLQFYLGYPLRLLTAEASAWLLGGAGLAVSREGSALQVEGQLVMVDAPCSCIQMAWAAYFTAFAAAAWLRLPDRLLLRRIPLLGALVLVANILRNSLLVLQETGRLGGPGWLHEGIGLAVFAALCQLVLRVVAFGAPRFPATVDDASVGAGPRLCATLCLLYLGIGLWPLGQTTADQAARSPMAFEWPRQLAGRELRPLALSPLEVRFAEQFPGAIGRFSDGEGVLVLRHVLSPTRRLHPAADCFRGLGYSVGAETLRRRGEGAGLQRCFVARGADGAMSVCEHIEDAAGRVFSDHSAWYWSALAGDTQGPWLAVTSARPLP